MIQHSRGISPIVIAFAVACAVSGALVTTASATTATTNLQVTATVISACSVSATTLNFGSSINPTSAVLPLDSTATLTVLCTATTPYTVALNAGTNAAGNFSNRAIKNGGSTLGYQLYNNSLRTVVWDDASGAVPGTGSGANQSLTVYGRLPSLSGAVPGAYTDTVVVTITY